MRQLFFGHGLGAKFRVNIAHCDATNEAKLLRFHHKRMVLQIFGDSGKAIDKLAKLIGRDADAGVGEDAASRVHVKDRALIARPERFLDDLAHQRAGRGVLERVGFP